MLRFFIIFLLIQLGLFTAELTRPIQKAVVTPFTESIAALSAWIVKAFDPDVISHGIVLYDRETEFAVAIQAGCNGVEATIVLVAAMIAFPSPWKMKLIGIAVGFIAIQVMNIARIISLFYLGQWNQLAFEWAHLYIWQALIMLDVLVVFLLWLRFLPSEEKTTHVSQPG